MKSLLSLLKKHPKIRLRTFVLVTIILLFICVLLILLNGNIDESGYASNFDKVPGIQDKKIFVDKIAVENNLFFYRIGWLENWSLYIIGKFTSETTSIFFNNPNTFGLSTPRISYQDQIPISSCPWTFKNIPVDIASKLKLRREDKLYYSDLDDNLILFESGYEKFHIRIYLLGRSGYFIISIIHNTR